MSANVVLRLTEAQAHAVAAALGYATSGAPEEGGLRDRAQQRAAERAHEVVSAALLGLELRRIGRRWQDTPSNL